MKTKTVYVIEIIRSYGSEYQYFKPSELHLIKTILNDGYQIKSVSKEEISLNRYKSIFE